LSKLALEALMEAVKSCWTLWLYFLSEEVVVAQILRMGSSGCDLPNLDGWRCVNKS